MKKLSTLFISAFCLISCLENKNQEVKPTVDFPKSWETYDISVTHASKAIYLEVNPCGYLSNIIGDIHIGTVNNMYSVNPENTNQYNSVFTLAEIVGENESHEISYYGGRYSETHSVTADLSLEEGQMIVLFLQPNNYDSYLNSYWVREGVFEIHSEYIRHESLGIIPLDSYSVEELLNLIRSSDESECPVSWVQEFKASDVRPASNPNDDL